MTGKTGRHCLQETRTIILYEAPHHLVKTLKELRSYLGNRRMTVCKELTKKYEKKLQGTLDEILAYYEDTDPRGEYVLVFEGRSPEEIRQEARKEWEAMTLEEHMAWYTDQGKDRKSAMKLVAKDRGLSRRDVYQALLEAE